MNNSRVACEAEQNIFFFVQIHILVTIQPSKTSSKTRAVWQIRNKRNLSSRQCWQKKRTLLNFAFHSLSSIGSIDSISEFLFIFFYDYRTLVNINFLMEFAYALKII